MSYLKMRSMSMRDGGINISVCFSNERPADWFKMNYNEDKNPEHLKDGLKALCEDMILGNIHPYPSCHKAYDINEEMLEVFSACHCNDYDDMDKITGNTRNEELYTMIAEYGAKRFLGEEVSLDDFKKEALSFTDETKNIYKESLKEMSGGEISSIIHTERFDVAAEYYNSDKKDMSCDLYVDTVLNKPENVDIDEFDKQICIGRADFTVEEDGSISKMKILLDELEDFFEKDDIESAVRNEYEKEFQKETQKGDIDCVLAECEEIQNEHNDGLESKSQDDPEL